MDLEYTKNLNKDKAKSCSAGAKYANYQNTYYDTDTNQMLYGINSRMKVLGVSDGTCNQINPLIYTNDYKCGSGAAGANPCAFENKDYILENMDATPYNISDYTGVALVILVFIIIVYIIIYHEHV